MKQLTTWPRHRIALLLIVALAAALRLIGLESMPPGLYHDEAYNGLDAISLINDQLFPQFYESWELYAQDAHADRAPRPTQTPVFFEGNYGREPLHIYLMSLTVRIFGPRPFAIRLVPALSGIVAVITTYIAAASMTTDLKRRDRNQKRETHRRAIPLLSAFAIAIIFSAVHFSRFGLRAMVFVPVETLAVAAFWRALTLDARGQQPDGWRNQPRTWFIITGLLIGFGLYIYAAARLFPFVFALYLAVLFLRDRDAAKRLWKPALMMVGSAIAIALPLLIYFARYPYFLVFRTSFVANKGRGVVEGQPLLTWLNNIWRVAVGFFWDGEPHLRHNLPNRPYLDVIQWIFFLTGLFSLYIRPRFRQQGRHTFLVLWLGIMLLATLLSGDAPHFGRMVGALAPVAILIGIGANRLLELLSDRHEPSNQGLLARAWVPAAAVAGLLILSTGWTVYDYFGRYAQHARISADFYLPDWELGTLIANSEPDAAVYLTPHQPEMATLYFAVGGDRDRVHTYGCADDDPACVNSAIPLGRPGFPARYLLRPTQTRTLASLSNFYSNGITFDTGTTAANGFDVAADVPRVLPQFPTDTPLTPTIALLGWSQAIVEDQLFVTLFWQGTDFSTRPLTAFIHVLDDNGDIVAQLDRQPSGYLTSDWRPTEVVLDTFVIPFGDELASGPYQLRTGFYDSADFTPAGTPVLLGSVEKP